jgi:hypothetical protein
MRPAKSRWQFWSLSARANPLPLGGALFEREGFMPICSAQMFQHLLNTCSSSAVFLVTEKKTELESDKNKEGYQDRGDAR